MQSFLCRCGNPLFFDSRQCTACGLECGWCDGCRTVSPLVERDSHLVCGNRRCAQEVRKCANREQHDACNCHFIVTAEVEAVLCRSCTLTTVIPDLSLVGNLEQWRLLEGAKRRLLYDLESLRLVYDAQGGAQPPIAFEFKQDTAVETVTTGHTDGMVTINLREASPLEREAERQKFREPHRTLIGHFRHEVGHYFWMTLVQGHDEDAFVQQFGDHKSAAYAEAVPRYYADGPPADWATRFISQYASAHPWEDFAETSGFYLDMISVLDTVAYRLPQQVATPPPYDLDAMLSDYRRMGLIFNEINRTMGLTDLLPEIVSGPVIDKLRYVHGVYGASRP